MLPDEQAEAEPSIRDVRCAPAGFDHVAIVGGRDRAVVVRGNGMPVIPANDERSVAGTRLDRLCGQAGHDGHGAETRPAS